MNKSRADLHMHGSIGFQPYWLKKQGYAEKNLLQLIVDQCFVKGITIPQLLVKAILMERFGRR